MSNTSNETLKFQDVLSQTEIARLASFWKDDVLREAVRKAILFEVYYNGTMSPGNPVINPQQNAALALAYKTPAEISNEALGEEIRTFAQGISIVQRGFNRIGEVRPGSIPSPKEVNPAI